MRACHESNGPSGGKLDHHSHHSKNTHAIIRGSLTAANCRVRNGPVRVYKAGTEFPVAPDMCYHAEAGVDGCVFVEGHRRLSISTAERFVARGQFRRVDETQIVKIGDVNTVDLQEVFEAEMYEPTNCSHAS